jgi:hypothetical protein
MESLRTQFDRAAQQADETMGTGATMDFTSLNQLCDLFAGAPQSDRDHLPPVDGWLRIALQAYAWHCAEQAVVSREPRFLQRGLTALVIEGGEGDSADNAMRLAVLHHSANLLDADAPRLFSQAATLAGSRRVAAELSAFAARQSVDLESLSIHTEHTEGSFHYRYEGGARAAKPGWFRRRK